MPRQSRQHTGTGIYHVMMRGINRQDIFEEQEDYRQFLYRLQNLVDPIDVNGEHIPSYCHVYAYCLMSNHVHPAALSLCATNAVMKRISLDDLRGLVDTPLSDDVTILDIDENPRITIGDQEDRD